jgi:ATP-binding cassette subfamily B protein
MFRRFPCVLQHDVTDCGPAVLATVARTHGLRLSVGRIREMAGTDTRGTNLLALRETAQRLGFSAKGAEGDYEALLEIPLPVVVHVRIGSLDHFVVVHRVGRKRVLIADPARGLRRMSREEFEAIWTRVLLLLEPTEGIRSVEPSVSPVGRLLSVMRPHRGLLTEAFVCAVAFTLLGLAVSFYVKFLIDRVFVRGEIDTLHVVGLGMILIFVFRGLFGAFRQYLMIHLAQKIDVTLILGYYDHVLGLPMSFFKSRRVGEILSRLNDVSRIRALVGGTTLVLLLDATMVVFASVVMFYFDARLALVAFAGIPILATLVSVLHRPIRRIQRRVMEEAAEVEANLVESVTGVATLKSYNAERLARRKTEKGFIRMIHSLFRGGMIGTAADVSGMTVAASGSLAVLWYGAVLVLRGEMSVGELMFFNSLMGFLFEPAARLTSVNGQIQDALIATERLGEILDLSDEYARQEGGSDREIEGTLRFEGVSFRYGSRERVLHEIDLEIGAGETVALVGESGSGKTTLANLIPRFHDPEEGAILLDGIDLRDYELRHLRSSIGHVSQDPFLFTGTVRENISLGRPDADFSEIVDAARKANIHDFVMSLPERYDTVLREFGSSLSGGQKQRLAIARALLVDPRILILDEATSSLDSESEAIIQSMLRDYRRGRTTLVIAHRLSTVALADKIVVLSEGRVLETGSHAELMTRKGKYHSLWMRQLPPDLPGEAKLHRERITT